MCVKCDVYFPATFFLFCCLLLPFWKSTLLNQIPCIDYLMYSLYDQHDTTKDREKMRGEAERERGRGKYSTDREQSKTSSLYSNALCIITVQTCHLTLENKLLLLTQYFITLIRMYLSDFKTSELNYGFPSKCINIWSEDMRVAALYNWTLVIYI